MRLIEPSVLQPTTEPNRFQMDLSMLPGRSGFDIYAFNSGLKLVVVHTTLHQPVQIRKMIPESIAGLGFCLAGELDLSLMSSKPLFSIRAGQSGVFTYPRDIEITEHLSTELYAQNIPDARR